MSVLSRLSAYAGNPIEDTDELAARLKKKGKKIIKLNQGNPTAIFPTPKYIIDAYVSALKEGKTGYSFHAGIPELRQAVADRQNRLYDADFGLEDVIITQGVSESISFINSTFVDPGDRAVLLRPYYPTYLTFLKTVGGVPLFADYSEKEGFKFNPDSLEKALKKERKMPKFMIFSNPCNPTGTVMRRDELKEVV